MTILTINDAESAQFNAGHKAAAWATVRARLGIPRSVKLAVNNISGSADYRKLRVKGVNPRQYLLAGTGYYDRGKYSGNTTEDLNYGASGAVAVAAAAPTPTPAPVTPAPVTPTTTAAPATNGRFAVAGQENSNRNWRVASRSDLLALLRDEDQGDDATLPDGFPTNLGDDAIVLDPVTGNLYFRA